MVELGLSGEEPGEETVATVIENHSEHVLGWGGARRSDVCDYGFPPER